MKKTIFTLAAVVSTFLMASCNKELSIYGEDDIVVISAIIEDDATKTSLSGNDTEGYDVVWTKGDSFKIGNATFTLSEGAGTKSGKFTCSATQLKKLQNGTFTVYYPSTYNGAWPAAQNYNEDGLFTNYPMKASVTVSDLQVPESITFKNEGGILRLTVEATDQPEPVIVNSVTVSANEFDESISLYSGDGVTIDEGVAKDFYIAVPSGEYTGTTITFNTLDGKVFKKSMKAGKSLVVNRSAITTAKFSVKDYTEPFADGALPGVFSVSDSKKVVFSRGNMYWNGSSFQFEGSQLMYDDQWNESHVSHFFWSPESGTACAGEVDDEFFDNMLREDVFFTNAKGFTANGESDTWFTMSNEEWEYLLGRDGKCSFATVAGRKGWVIAPDNYAGTLKEKYDATEWPSAEADGLVFLPFAGRRMTADEMGDFETQGCYWSASLFLEDEEDASCADYYGFTPEDIFPDNTWRESGYAIRLVKEYSAPAAAPEPLPGKFSVSATKKVQFSKGNLWADASNALHFESDQWDCCSTYDLSHVSHFTWSDNVADAVGTTSSGSYIFCDESHKVSVDGTKAIYYVLGKAEWQYLFDNHEERAVTVNGVNGFVIAPDGVSLAVGKTEYTASEIEEDNLLFIPCSGQRSCLTTNPGDRILLLGNRGRYWTSTCYEELENWAYRTEMYQSDGDIMMGATSNQTGVAIRLVTDVVTE